MKSIISIVALAAAFVCAVSAHELRGGPKLLSDVAVNDGDLKSDGESFGRHRKGKTNPKTPNVSILGGYEDKTNYLTDEGRNQINKSPEHYPQTKFFADILTVEARTKAWNYKTRFSNILKKIDKTEHNGEVNMMHHKTVEVEGNPNPPEPFDPNPDDPDQSEQTCDDVIVEFSSCLQDEGMTDEEISACAECLDDAWEDVDVGTSCLDLNEVGYCEDLENCKDTTCTSNKSQSSSSCWDDAMDAVRCIVENDGCDESAFESECFSSNTNNDEPNTDDDPLPNPDTDPFDPDADDDPCFEYIKAQDDCLLSEGMSGEDAFVCVNCVWNAWKDIEWILCLALEEEGFCAEVLNCWETNCNNLCYDEAIERAGCLLHYGGCDDNEFERECITRM